MDRVAVPLSQMGASVEGVGERCLPPLVIRGGQLKGITYTVPVPSAQVKSAVLLAGLRADGPTMVLETTPTRQHTEEMLRRAGAELHHESVGSATAWHLRPGPLRPIDWEVPGDPSQAAFFIVAAILSTEGSLTVTDLYSGPQRSGFLEVLGRMGAALEFHHHEGSFDVVARPSTLRGTTVQAAEIPSLDEVPILAVAAARAHGRTVFHDVGELRVKESDRLAATAALVEAIGATATVVGDDLVIEGSAHGGGDFDLDPDGDHRLAMAAAVAALSAAPGVVGTISAPSCIKTSYPSFFRDLQSVGVAVVDVLE